MCELRQGFPEIIDLFQRDFACRDLIVVAWPKHKACLTAIFIPFCCLLEIQDIRLTACAYMFGRSNGKRLSAVDCC